MTPENRLSSLAGSPGQEFYGLDVPLVEHLGDQQRPSPRPCPGWHGGKEHMPSVTHQTIKLSKGKHSSPEGGACVMELASMLAGEPFSDHPQSVSPVIGSFLRAYNDAIEDDRRQDLYACASKVVGSRGSTDVERARGDRVLEWTAEIRTRRWTERLFVARLRPVVPQRRPSTEAIGTHAVRAIRRHTDETHRAVVALVDELLAIGVREPMSTEPITTQPRTRPPIRAL